MKLKKRTRKKIYKVSAIVVSAMLLYGAPFTGLYALEPEQIRDMQGRVIKW